MTSLLSHNIRRANKTHRCAWCGEPIEKNCLYEINVWADNGSVSRTKLHLECAWAADRFCREWNEDVFMPYDNKRGCWCESNPCVCVEEIENKNAYIKRMENEYHG